jgi:hypothetical protein
VQGFGQINSCQFSETLQRTPIFIAALFFKRMIIIIFIIFCSTPLEK